MNRRVATILLPLLALAFMLFTGLNRTSVNRRAVIWSDAEGYYKYLPALFLLGDVHQMEPGSIWPAYNDQGEFVDKYSCGVAWFQLPFFGLAVLEHTFRGLPMDDHYDALFARWMVTSGVFYPWLGLMFLFWTLRRQFPVQTTAWTLAAVYFGTNLFHYTTKEMGISHPYSFFLFSVLLWHTPRFLARPDMVRTLVLGMLLGWITLIRPTNIIVALLLVGYEVYSRQALIERLHWLLRHWHRFVLAGLAACLVWLPQFLYWHTMTGHWFYYSYGEESFKYWNEPKIAAVLFDVQNGLFLYSPMALLMVAGTILGICQKQYQGPVVLVLFSIATYLFASWWAWWFGGAFGHRSFVEYYALLAVPLAGLFATASGWRKWPRRLFLGLVVVLMIYSVRMSHLYTHIGGPWDGPDWRWNLDKYKWILKHFFRLH